MDSTRGGSPPRIILLDGSGTISLHVLAWLAEQNVPVIRMDCQGKVQTVIANSGYASNPHRLAWQVEAARRRVWAHYSVRA
jgi:CRISP-associated protein Cas1